MPFEMADYIQSVVVEGTVYVGGGYAGFGSRNNYIVMAYDVTMGKWATLPPYRARTFAMAVINSSQVVLVGGLEHTGERSKMIGVWGAGNKKWTHPYPNMRAARSSCSAVVYNEWLVVAGGMLSSRRSVEVMNIDGKQWFSGPPCLPLYFMKTAIVGADTCYFMGGAIENAATATTKVYSVSLPHLISQLDSDESDRHVWKEISVLQTTYSTPLSISGSLFAVGGKDRDRKAVTAIHLYQPKTGEWVKVGDLSIPCYNCTCALLNPNREVLVAGGTNSRKTIHKIMAIAKLH